MALIEAECQNIIKPLLRFVKPVLLWYHRNTMLRYPKLITLIVITIIAITMSGCTIPFIKQDYAGLQIDAIPGATVYLDEKHVGPTKYFDEKLKPSEYTIKLVPLTDNLPAWETRVKLLAGKTTIINREFGATLSESSNYILQLEKISNKKSAELTIVTTPENVIVRLDDQPKGFSPLTNLGLSPDTHKVTLSIPGYKTLNINVNTIAGFRVLLTAELGKAPAFQATATPSATIAATPATPSASPNVNPSPLATPSPTPSPSIKPSPTPTVAKPYVEITTTPTGWLRVRSEPNGLIENEVARINPGETYPFIESNDAGWYKIEYAAGKQGWIAATYAKLVK